MRWNRNDVSFLSSEVADKRLPSFIIIIIIIIIIITERRQYRLLKMLGIIRDRKAIVMGDFNFVDILVES